MGAKLVLIFDALRSAATALKIYQLHRPTGAMTISNFSLTNRRGQLFLHIASLRTFFKVTHYVIRTWRFQPRGKTTAAHIGCFRAYCVDVNICRSTAILLSLK